MSPLRGKALIRLYWMVLALAELLHRMSEGLGEMVIRTVILCDTIVCDSAAAGAHSENVLHRNNSPREKHKTKP
jgi:hypothetical protein